MKRVSVVGCLDIGSIQFASVLGVGDAVTLRPRSLALAVQRQVSEFFGNEGNFAEFPIFTRQMKEPPELEEPVFMKIENREREIRVGCIDVLGVSASSHIQIGSVCSIDADARVKHIRQLLQPDGPAGPASSALQ